MGSFRAWIVLLVGAAILGLLAARFSSSPKGLRSEDNWADDDQERADVTTAADRWGGSSGSSGQATGSPRPEEMSAWERFVTPEPLPDSVFKHRTGSGRILYEQIHSAISSEGVELRDLNRREGSFLRDKKGWARFDGSRFVPVNERDLPEDLKDRAGPTAEKPIDQARAPEPEAP